MHIREPAHALFGSGVARELNDSASSAVFASPSTEPVTERFFRGSAETETV